MLDYSNIPRDSTRVPLAHRIQLKFDRFSGFINEYVSNISPGGIFIRTDSPELPGQLLEFEFRLGDGFELIRGKGEVVWSRAHPESPERPAGMGVRFLELSPGSKDLIYKIVDDYMARGGKPFDLTPPAATPPPWGSGQPGGPQAGQPALPWEIEVPAIRPLPGVPAITPLSPFDRLAAGDAGHEPVPGEAFPAAPSASAEAGGVGGLDGGHGGHGAHGASDANDGWGGVAGSDGLDPLEQMLASLPPLDDLAMEPTAPAPVPPAAAGLAPLVTPAPPAPPAAAAPPPAWPPSVAPVVPPGTAAPAAAGHEEPAPAHPGAPQLFSSFDLRAGRRRSRLPLIGLLLALALLGVGAYLARDLVLGWFEGSERRASAPAAGSAEPGSPLPAGARPGRAPRHRGPAVLPPDEGAPRASRVPPPGAAGGAGASAPGRGAAASAGDAGAAGAPPPGAAAAAPGALAFSPGTPGAASGPGGSGGSGANAGADHGTGGGAAVSGASGASAGTAVGAGNPGNPGGGGSLPPPLVSARPSPSGSPAAPAAPQTGAAGTAPSPAAGSEAAGFEPSSRLTVLERITFQASRGGTDVILWGDGDFPASSYTRTRVGGIGGLPVREVVRLIGITRPFSPQQIGVRSAEVAQIRTGYHKPQELHVVMDLADREVRVTGVEAGPHQLRLHLAAGAH